MSYCTVQQVYDKAGITETEVSKTRVKDAILDAEADVDKFTYTTYWKTEFSGTASSGTDATIVDSGESLQSNEYISDYVWITGGTGEGQLRTITSNDGTTLSISEDWDTNPDNTSTYKIIHTGTNPVVEEKRDGDGTAELFVSIYPIKTLKSVVVDDTTVTVSKIYVDKQTGRLRLGGSLDPEASYWSVKEFETNVINYWFGVDHIPRNIQRLTVVKAAITTLIAQQGSTHNIPSTISLPEGSLSVGQAYVNIGATITNLRKEESKLETGPGRVRRYHPVV